MIYKMRTSNKQCLRLHDNHLFVKNINSTLPKILVLTIIFFISLSFISCDNEVYFEQEYLVENSTNKEFLVCFEYGYPDIDIKIIDRILPNEVNHVLYNKTIFIPESAIGTSEFNIWIYNSIDSVYYRVNRLELDTKTHGNVTVVRTDSKTDLVKYIYNVQITEYLLLKMIKNIHLTDSVFELKK